MIADPAQEKTVATPATAFCWQPAVRHPPFWELETLIEAGCALETALVIMAERHREPGPRISRTARRRQTTAL